MMMPLGLVRRNSPEHRVVAVFRPQHQNGPQAPAEEESTPTPSAITTPQRVVLGKRKRGGDEHLAQQARHHEQSLAQVDRHWQLTMEAVARAREEEMALRREEEMALRGRRKWP
ncbi:hypothetical protein CesoFtcFv8_014931 [Champsocephalus esox]|uniref:Uncharacterized protein n=1 Tax=Champsocephalus esox TaxID=159716 RepID=A0AAN8GSV1_9TELE|nr:hypothetical protein CesoFtcFv8_014931 [Champsocephalus esox]